jgi:dienelactone hydrolase
LITNTLDATLLTRKLKVFLGFILCLQLASCATFENHKGEKFPFNLKVIENSTPASSIIISHGGSCRLPQEEMWGAKFREWGYNVVIIDHCSARRIIPHTGIEPPPLSTENRVNDYIATAEWIKVQKWHQGKVAVFGISRGGEAVLRASDTRFNRVRRGLEGMAELDVYIALYPPCSTFPKAPRAPLLILHGELDNLADFNNCEYSTREHKNLTIKTYPNAHHGFDVPGNTIYGSGTYLRSFISRSYESKAAEKSLSDTKEFLEKNLRQ